MGTDLGGGQSSVRMITSCFQSLHDREYRVPFHKSESTSYCLSSVCIYNYAGLCKDILVNTDQLVWIHRFILPFYQITRGEQLLSLC